MSNGVSIKPGRLACLPLSFLAEQELVDAYARTGDGSLIYQDVMTTALWVYQLYCYKALIGEYFGDSIAEQVIEQQQAIFDGEQPGVGEAIAAALKLIDIAMDAAKVFYKTEDSEYRLSVEGCVALALLSGLPESPDYHRGTENSDRQAHKIAGIDEKLAGLLREGQQALTNTFTPLFHMSKLA